MWRLIVGVSCLALAQPQLQAIEKQLAQLGPLILNHEDYTLKDSLNKRFIALWLEAFTQPEAFSYSFDSVVTVSDLCPPDSAFRILTWQIVDFAERRHEYYGILIRRWKPDKKAPYTYKVFVLKEIPEVLQEDDIDQRTLDHTEWVGALYYHPRYSQHGVLRYESRAKVPRGGKLVKEKLVYYVLLGWNGYDKRRNFKVVETLFFDPKQPDKVFFGAPVLYVGVVPKMRLILPYSETTALSLNMGWFVPYIGSRKRQAAIIFDHIATGRRSQKTNFDDLRPSFGADGTYDALVFFKRLWFENRKGLLVYRRNVIPYAPEIEHYDPKVIQRQAEEARKRLNSYGF